MFIPKQMEPYMNPTLPPNPAYSAFNKYGSVKEVTNVVRMDTQQAVRLVFSFTRAEVTSPKTT